MPFNRKDQANLRQNDETPSVIKREVGGNYPMGTT